MNRFKVLAFAVVVMIVASAVSALACTQITQACTPGFFKNHPEFINGYSCGVYNQDTTVSTLFPTVDSCVGNLSLLGLLQSPTSVCGTGNTFPGAEVILLRQAITRVLNGTNSSPIACGAAGAVINKTNNTINDAIATDNVGEIKSLGNRYSTLNNDNPCTIGN
jgi:hypothetical protein